MLQMNSPVNHLIGVTLSIEKDDTHKAKWYHKKEQKPVATIVVYVGGKMYLLSDYTTEQLSPYPITSYMVISVTKGWKVVSKELP